MEDKLRGWLKGFSRLAVVGVGNKLRGDDGAGVLVVERLMDAGLPEEKIRLIVAEVSPENFIGKILEFKPSHVLMVDAAVFGAEPGALDFFPIEKVSGIAFSTHRLPLTLLASYLKKSLSGVKVGLLAIQPKVVGWESPLSSEVLKTVNQAVSLLISLLRGFQPL